MLQAVIKRMGDIIKDLSLVLGKAQDECKSCPSWDEETCPAYKYLDQEIERIKEENSNGM